MRFATKQVCLTLLLVLPLFAMPAHAVRLAQGEPGQVAIVPLYNTLGGSDTLLKISNGPAYSAVRLQMRNPDGERTEAFNIYLAPNQAWRAALTMRADGPWLTTTDTKCALGNDEISAIAPLQSDVPLAASYGYIEVLLMGHIDDADVQFDVASQACESLAARFSQNPWDADTNSGLSAPTDTLRVVAQLINVERGTQYGLEPVHLARFRDRPLHVPPAEAFGLADVYDQGTAAGETGSLVCADECRLETWADPRDAVSSVLLAVAREADYVTNPDIGASSSFVILNPMHPYYAAEEFPDHETGLFVSDSDAGILNFCLFPQPPPGTPLDTICPRPIRLQEPKGLTSFSVPNSGSDTAETVPMPILGIPGLSPDTAISTRIDEFLSGSFQILFLTFDNPSLVSNDQSEFFGLPSIVIGFTEFQNGELDSLDHGAVRANYGTSALGVRIVTNPGDL